MGDGHVVVTAILPIALSDITGSLARECGFKGVLDLLKVAQHGPGRNVFLIDFYYEKRRLNKRARLAGERRPTVRRLQRSD
jgi:hypothetical protein